MEPMILAGAHGGPSLLGRTVFPWLTPSKYPRTGPSQFRRMQGTSAQARETMLEAVSGWLPRRLLHFRKDILLGSNICVKAQNKLFHRYPTRSALKFEKTGRCELCLTQAARQLNGQWVWRPSLRRLAVNFAGEMCQI